MPLHDRLPSRVLLALAILGSAMALGAVDVPVLVPLAALVAGVAVLAVARGGTDRIANRRSKVVTSTLPVLFGWTVLQCIPLPIGVVRVLSPTAADVWSRSVEPLHQSVPGWVTLSVDPSATKVEALKLALYLAAFVASALVTGRRTGTTFLVRSMIVSSVVIVSLTLVHSALGLRSVYGFYAPRTGVGVIGPLLNTNHIAAYANVGLILALSSLFDDEPVAPRVLLGAAVLALVGAEVWLASRGAVGALVFVVAALVLKRNAGRRPRFIAPMLVSAGGVVMAVVALAPSAIPGLLDTDVSKLGLTKLVLVKMVPAYPLFGAGRGTFESAFPAFREGVSFIVWTHPENLVAQWVSEWGIPVSVGAIAALAWAVWPKNVFHRGTSGLVGPWLVVAATLLHNMVDFNMETPAVALVVWTCAGIALARSEEGSRRRDVGPTVPHRRGLRRSFVYALLVVPTGFGAILALTGGSGLLADRKDVFEAVPLDRASDVTFHERIAAAIHRHPAEPYFPYLGGERARLEGSDDVVIWAGRCLERAPVYPPAHLLLARHFRRRSASQARLEYRIAAEQGDEEPIVAEVLPLVTGYEEALELTPTNGKAVTFLDEIADAVRLRLPSTRWRVDGEILRRAPTHSGALLRRSHDALLDLRDAPWCASAGDCPKLALDAALAAERAAPNRCAARVDHAWASYLSGATDAALDGLSEAVGAVDDPGTCLQELAALATAAHRERVATDAIDRLARTSCSVGLPCIENLLLAADVESGRGGTTRSVVFLRRAVELAPSDRRALERLASATSAAGLHAESATTYDSLATLTGEARYRALASGERSSAYQR